MRVKPLQPGPVWRFLSSIYLAIGLILSLAIVCVIGHALGIEEAEQVFFEAWWFSGLMIVLAINITFGTLNRSLASPPGWFPWRLSQVPWLMVHVGLLTIIAGGILTRGRTEGQLYVREGESERTIMLADRQLVIERPATSGDRKEAHPLRLTHLPRTAEGATLADRRDRVIWTGTFVWIALTALLGGLAAVIAGREPATIVLAVLVPLGVIGQAFAIARSDLSLEAFGGAAKVELVRYYPHHVVKGVIEDDPARDGPPGVRFSLRSQGRFALQTEEAIVPLRFDIENRAMLESGAPLSLHDGATIAAQRLFAPEEAERALAGQPGLGSLVLSAGGQTLPVNLDGIVVPDGPDAGRIDREVQVGGFRLHLARFFWQLQVEEVDGKTRTTDGARGAPGARGNPAVEIDRVTMPDGAVDGTPRFAFGAPELRRMTRDMQAVPGLTIDFEQPVWRIPAGRSLSFVLLPDGSTRLLTQGYADSPPPPRTYADLQLLPRATAGVAVPMNATTGLEVAWQGSSPSVRQATRVEPVDPTVTEKGDEKPDAVYVKVTRAGGASGEGWLSFTQASTLQVGDQAWKLTYTAQMMPLPFDVHLKRFDVEWAPGQEGTRPLAFTSEVRITPPLAQATEQPLGPDERAAQAAARAALPGFEYPIAMNHTLVHEGFTLYQQSFIEGQDGQPRVSVLAVQSDPGQYVFYAGALLLSIGVAGFFWAQPALRRLELRWRGQAPAPVLHDEVPAPAPAGAA